MLTLTESAVLYAVLAIVLSAAVYTDFRWGKIYNWITVPGFLVGLLLNAIFLGLPGLLLGLEGAALALGLYILLSLFGRLMGAGDAKLLMAVGALLGPSLLGWSVVYGAIVGGVLALLLALTRCRLQTELGNMGNSVLLRFFAGYRLDLHSSTSLRMPYALPLALGAMLSVVFHSGVIPL